MMPQHTRVETSHASAAPTARMQQPRPSPTRHCRHQHLPTRVQMHTMEPAHHIRYASTPQKSPAPAPGEGLARAGAVLPDQLVTLDLIARVRVVVEAASLVAGADVQPATPAHARTHKPHTWLTKGRTRTPCMFSPCGPSVSTPQMESVSAHDGHRGQGGAWEGPAAGHGVPQAPAVSLCYHGLGLRWLAD